MTASKVSTDTTGMTTKKATSSSGIVLVRLLPSRRRDGRDVLLLEGGSGELTVDALRTLGLTERESDALRRLALGRRPAEAANELGIAPRTFDKHLQHIYAKLGVTSRRAAVRQARELDLLPGQRLRR